MKKLLYVTAAAAVMLASCKKDKEDNPQQEDNPQPKFNIVELPFSVYTSQRATIEDVQNALTAKADSVYLVSKEDFDISDYKLDLAYACDAANKLTAISPRVRGKGIINPPVEVAESSNSSISEDFIKAGFKYIPGYIKPN